ncbi:MAG: hypothetical protein FJ144_07355 [Deltaproteobacteria bacterium]|nr:hypothetical protein [Deltaproteobacteria bacterium]
MMRLPRSLAAAVAATTLAASAAPAWADEVVQEEIITEETTAPSAEATTTETTSPTAAGIITDLLIGRPTLLMATIAGTAFYVLALPITIPGDLEPESRDRFLLPAQQFVKTPLGGDLTPSS